MTVSLSLAEIAVRYGCELRGDPDAHVTQVASIDNAGDKCLTFLTGGGFRRSLAGTRATAVILRSEDADICPVNCLVTANPYALYAAVAAELYPEPPLRPGRHVTAVVGQGGSIPATCEIGPGVVLGDEVVLGERVSIGANCVLGDRVHVGADSRLFSHVSVYADVVLGCRNRLHSGAVIGADGFGIAQSDHGWVKVPQTGSVVTGDDVEIGANSCVDRGAIDDTRLGNDVKIDNHVHIAHNVQIGDHTAIAGQSGVAGSARIGARCLIGGAVAVSGHISIADDVVVLGRASVANSIHEPGVYSSAIGVEEVSRWRRIAARVKRLDDMGRRLRKLEQACGIGRKAKD